MTQLFENVTLFDMTFQRKGANPSNNERKEKTTKNVTFYIDDRKMYYLDVGEEMKNNTMPSEDQQRA